jgi:hypothetical protein
MKKIILSIVICATTTLTQAQKEVKVEINDIGVSYSYPALEVEFNKSITYKVMMPTALNYHRGMEVEGLFNPYGLQLPGKYVLPKQEAAYTIQVTTMGLTAAETKGDRVWEKKIPGQNPVTGYLRDYKVYFPCDVTIYKGLEIVKKVQVFGKNTPINIVFDRGFIQPSLRTSTNEGELFPFSSPAEIERLDQATIFKMLERAASWQVYAQVKSVAEDLFVNNAKETDQAKIAAIKKKKREFVFDDIDAAVEKYKSAIALIKAGNKKDADTTLESVKKTLIDLVNTKEPRIDKNVVEVLQYDIAWTYFWLGDYNNTRLWLDLYKKGTLAHYDEYSYDVLAYRLKRAAKRSKLLAANAVLNE